MPSDSESIYLSFPREFLADAKDESRAAWQSIANDIDNATGTIVTFGPCGVHVLVRVGGKNLGATKQIKD